MEKLRGEVISTIRGCLISNKSEMTLRQLENDYRTLCGERIPYARVGFKRLDEFIQSEPTLFLRTVGQEQYVVAKASEKSVHIKQMVDKQKAPKKSAFQKAVKFNGPSYRHPIQPNRWRPKDANNRWKTNFHNSPRLAAVSHNQFINRPANRSPPQSYQQYNTPKKDLSERFQVHTDKKPQPISNNSQTINQNGQSNNPPITAQYKIPVNNVSPPKPELPSSPCASLMSAKRRLTKKMSEITLEREVDNTSPASDIAPKSPEEPQFTRTDNPSLDLKNFAQLHKLGEVEISSKEVQAKKKAQRFFTCKIKVDKNAYYSYPEEFRDAAEAEKYCANKALEDLIPKHSRRKSLLLANYIDILSRIPPMLEKHPHGIWGWQLELDYADKYNELLPKDWLKIIDTSACIQVEKCQDNFVLMHCKPGDVLQKGQKWSTPMRISDVSVPSNTVQFGDDGKLAAQVTYVMSANEIWCRQCDNLEFETYNNMMMDMEVFYNAHAKSQNVESLNEGRYYVAQFDHGWYRIRAVSIEGDEVTCFFIDFGDESVLPKKCIYQMKREFAICQAQAFVCRLAGLEELYEVSVNSEKLQSIMSKQVIIELAADNIDENDLSTPVYMYDIDSGKSINQELIPLLTIESAFPTLQQGSVTEVYITNIESNGDVYIQLHSRGYESLQELLLNLETQIVENPPTAVLEPLTKQNSEGKLYFAKYKVDDHWYRVKVIDWAPQGNFAQIYFVDYGNTDVINVNNETLYPLDKLSDVLSQYPFQAVKVKMALDAIPPDFAELACKLMPSDHSVLLKILSYDIENIPLVEFFKRSAEDILFCINKSIVMETELKNCGDGNNNTKSSKRKIISFSDGLSKNVPSGGTLQRPSLPNLDEYFEIRVSFAVNPWNFFVQPLKSQVELHNLMEKLQDRYQNVQYSPLQTEDILPGQIYASKHEDGCWYRTSVIKVIHKGSISVFYCDFGYYSNLTVQQLISLDPEFLNLPYQAIKAKLTDIKPKQNKWTMEDCEFFKTRVEKHNFYSVLKDIEKDELYDSDIVLSLILIDTSGQDDVYIGKDLIKRGIAVKC